MRGEGAHVWDDGGTRYLDATASLWYCNVGWGRREIAEAVAAQMRALPGVLHVRRPHEPPRVRARRAGGGARPGARLEGLPHERRLGLDRHGHEDGAPLLAARAASRTARPDPAREGLPRHAHGGDVARRHPRERGRPRRADRGRRRGAVGRRRRRCAPAIERRGAGPRGRVLLRAGDRRRRRLPAAAGLPRPRCARSAATPACCSSPTRSSPGSGGAATGSRPRGSGWSPTSSRARRASPAATCRWARCWRRRASPSPSGPPGAGMWRHGYTYSGHAAVAAAALANLDILEREDLCGRALELEALAASRRSRRWPTTSWSARSAAGRACWRPSSSARPGRGRRGAAAGASRAACREAGLLVRPLVGGAIAVSPPLVDRRRRPGGARRGVPRRPRRLP